MKAIILKTIVLIGIYFFGLRYCDALYAQLQNNSLKIIITNIKKQGAPVVIKIWDQGNYMSNKPFKEIKVQTGSENSILVNVNDLPNGEYGISLFHDINRNNKLDKSWIGKPTEPIGFSNNARPNFGPPAYDGIKFPFKKDMTITINLI
jgi:uncharacterized protein (DUF2141 family)